MNAGGIHPASPTERHPGSSFADRFRMMSGWQKATRYSRRPHVYTSHLRVSASRARTSASRRFATADLRGQVVAEVVARGKHLLVRTDGKVSIHSHLGMDGGWRLYDPGERWRGRSFEVRAVLETDRRIAVGHRLRRLEVLRTQRRERCWVISVPDVLGPDWDEGEVVRRLTALPERPVGEALWISE